MKKIFLIIGTIGIMYDYNVFAYDIPSNGCEYSDDYECQVWQVTPEGAGMILERGYNSASIVD